MCRPIETTRVRRIAPGCSRPDLVRPLVPPQGRKRPRKEYERITVFRCDPYGSARVVDDDDRQRKRRTSIKDGCKASISVALARDGSGRYEVMYRWRHLTHVIGEVKNTSRIQKTHLGWLQGAVAKGLGTEAIIKLSQPGSSEAAAVSHQNSGLTARSADYGEQLARAMAQGAPAAFTEVSEGIRIQRKTVYDHQRALQLAVS